jgi:dTDP-glucose 4,6-dehydratase
MILVTGGCGFIGSNFIINWFERSSEDLINIDAMTYAANKENLKNIKNKDKYNFIEEDIFNQNSVLDILNKYKPRAVFNFAAESHVDNSIESPDAFIKTNINGTFNLLKSTHNYWKKLSENEKNLFRFIHISTDEVFGSLSLIEKAFTEDNKYAPNSPYSASKASSDHLVRCFHHTYSLPIIITNCSNNYGPHQHDEKLVPKVIKNALNLDEIPIYGSGKQVRDWLYVEDHVDALLSVFKKGRVCETYNIGGNNEKNNIEVVQNICNTLDGLVPNNSNKISQYSDLISFVKDRQGHDFRYAINASKIKNELQWSPKENFESGMKKTIQWYLDNNY